jgi:hypothetical protein
MRKMGARSVVELVGMIDQLKGRTASWPMAS